MKQERTESRWAKMKSWADEHESARQEDERRAPERERVQAQQREVERVAEKKRQKLARSNEMAEASRPLIVVLGCTMLLCGLIATRYRLVERDWVFMPDALQRTASLAALIVCAVEAVRVRRKFGRPLDLQAWFLLLLVVPFAAFMATTFAGITLNGLLDTSPVEVHRSRIERRYVSRGSKGGPHYNLCLRDWKNPRAIARIETSQSLYEQAETSRPAIVETKPGFFGFEWVVRLSIR